MNLTEMGKIKECCFMFTTLIHSKKIKTTCISFLLLHTNHKSGGLKQPRFIISQFL